MKYLKICLACSFAFFLLLGLVWNHGKWDKYYKNKIGQPPRQLIVEALNRFQKPGKAIDLGCGVGNEAAVLLNHGWEVWAVDGQSKAIQMIKERADIKDPEKLVLTVASFEDATLWNGLPEVDFIYASYALPFSKREKFYDVWANIVQKLNQNGRFAGHFFGLNYRGFNNEEIKEMTFLTKDEILHLFQGFEIEYFQEIEKDDESGTGHTIHSHIFEVIAQKK